MPRPAEAGSPVRGYAALDGAVFSREEHRARSWDPGSGSSLPRTCVGLGQTTVHLCLQNGTARPHDLLVNGPQTSACVKITS